MIDKKEARLRRARRSRAKIAELKVVRLAVHRTNGHIYAQVISACGTKVLTAASTLEKEVRATVAKRRQRKGGRGRRQAHRRQSQTTRYRAGRVRPRRIAVSRPR